MGRVALLTLAIAAGLAAAAAAFAGPLDPQLHKRAADVRLAKTLIMRLRDLPAGFVDKGRQKQNSSPTPDIPCAQPNLHALVMTADVSSHNFVRTRVGAYAEATSEATFFLRPAQAEKVVGIMASARIGRCLKQVVLKSVNKLPGTVTIVGVHLVPLSTTTGDLHARLWDMFITFKAHGLRFRDELVLAFLRRGRVVSSLMLNTLNGLTQDEAKNISAALSLRLESLPKSAVR